MVEKGYTFRLNPNKVQERLIQNTFGCTRYVFNYYLSQRIEQYKQTATAPTRYSQEKQLTALKRELTWLKEVDATALQAALQVLDAAYQNFFRRVKQGSKPGFPRFKSKKNKHHSYKSKNNNNSIAALDKRIKLPKLGLVKCRVSRQMEGRILSATISQKPSGKYFVSVCCTDVARKPLEPTGAVAGIDLGLHDFAVTSDGVTIIRQESRWQDSMRKP